MKKQRVHLELEFFTPNSLIFRYRDDGITSEVHVHMSQYHVINVTIMICDINNVVGEESLKYIDSIISELDTQISQTLGFLKKGIDIEEFFSVRYNNYAVTLPPDICGNKNHEALKNNMSSIIYNGLKNTVYDYKYNHKD